MMASASSAELAIRLLPPEIITPHSLHIISDFFETVNNIELSLAAVAQYGDHGG